jgi:hypothetical protein
MCLLCLLPLVLAVWQMLEKDALKSLSVKGRE